MRTAAPALALVPARDPAHSTPTPTPTPTLSRICICIALLAEQAAHPPQHAVLLRVVGVVLARDLEHGREGGRVGVDAVSDAFRDLYVGGGRWGG